MDPDVRLFLTPIFARQVPTRSVAATEMPRCVDRDLGQLRESGNAFRKDPRNSRGKPNEMRMCATLQCPEGHWILAGLAHH